MARWASGACPSTHSGTRRSPSGLPTPTVGGVGEHTMAAPPLLPLLPSLPTQLVTHLGFVKAEP